MAKRVIIVHRWAGKPDTDWYPWLKAELETKGYEVLIPEMPNPEHPTIEEYVSFLSGVVGEPDMETHFVAHSIGSQTVMRYIASLDVTVGDVVFVGGWFTLMGLEDEEVEAVARPWVETPIDTDKVKENTQSITAIFSDDDYYVDLENKKFFEERLDAETIVEHKQGHFTEKDGVKEIQIILNHFS